MEFKEAMKTRKRMCDYYSKCKDCPLFMLDSCLSTLEEVNELDEYEKILEEWVKEHTVMTNADKYIEIIKNTFGEDAEKTETMELCIGSSLGIKCIHNCEECLKWWNEEYKEPEKEKDE